MPEGLLKEFIDKECIVSLIGNEHIEMVGKVVGVEGYWIKINEEDSLRIINGALIRDIKIKRE